MRDNRKRIATSHEGKRGYYYDADDRYIYQRNETTGEWIGWFCSLGAWENTFSKADWIMVTSTI